MSSMNMIWKGTIRGCSFSNYEKIPCRIQRILHP